MSVMSTLNQDIPSRNKLICYSLKIMPLSVCVSGIYTIEQDQIAKIIKNNRFINRTFIPAFKQV